MSRCPRCFVARGKRGEKKKIMDSLTDRPFAGIGKVFAAARRKKLLSGECEGGNALAHDEGEPVTVDAGTSQDGNSDTELFLNAMKEVVPLRSRNVYVAADEDKGAAVSSRLPPVDQDLRVVEQLNSLISGDIPFPVKHTPEFVEEAGFGVDVRICRKLHQGVFSVQDYCDLHGFDAMSAVDECAAFIARALVRGARCVALIHGRGLSSPGGPVLKEVVVRWLSRGPYRRFVVAFASAPPWDGGAGVTYVLLRRSPARRRGAKGRRRNS